MYCCQSCSWRAEQGKSTFLCLRSCLNIWSRETGSEVPFRVSLLVSIFRLNLVLTYGTSRVPRCRQFMFLSRHTPSGQSRVDRVRQLRTDSVHCQGSAGAGAVNLKVVPNECCLGRSPWTNKYAPLFPTLIYYDILSGRGIERWLYSDGEVMEELKEKAPIYIILQYTNQFRRHTLLNTW